MFNIQNMGMKSKKRSRPWRRRKRERASTWHMKYVTLNPKIFINWTNFCYWFEYFAAKSFSFGRWSNAVIYMKFFWFWLFDTPITSYHIASMSINPTEIINFSNLFLSTQSIFQRLWSFSIGFCPKCIFCPVHNPLNTVIGTSDINKFNWISIILNILHTASNVFTDFKYLEILFLVGKKWGKKIRNLNLPSQVV